MSSEDFSGSDLERTALFGLHVAAGARMVDFAGWEMPVSYAGILEEHRTVRTAVGLFDVSHMGEFWVGGPQAAEFLDYLVTNRVADCPPGKAVYSPMCDEKGGVVDDLIAYRQNDGSFLVVVNASNRSKDWGWMNSRTGLFDVELKDVSPEWGLLAVQGPQAEEYLTGHGFPGLSSLKRFHLAAVNWNGRELLVSRTGYTGEDGFEIFVPAGEAEAFARDIGAGAELPWIGLGARDSLRLEAGLPLHGHEMSETISPVQAGFGWTVKTDKPSFIGKEALQMEKNLGPEKRVRFFLVDDKRIAREGMPIVANGQEIGTVLAGSKSPVLNQPIGSALVDASFDDSVAAVESRGKELPIRFAKPPLHRTTS